MAEPITVKVVRRVRPGMEAAFEKALHDFLEQSLSFKGQQGVHVLRPPPNDTSREYGILRQFASEEDRDAFYDLSLFAEWQARVEPLTEGSPAYEQLTGLETWFALPGRRSIVPPPRYKMAAVTLLGVYPTSIAVGHITGLLLTNGPELLRALAAASLIVILLTWAVMPLLTQIFRAWLHPNN